MAKATEANGNYGKNRLIIFATEWISKKNPKPLSTKREVAIPNTAFAGSDLDTEQAEFAPVVRGKNTATPESATSNNSIAEKAGPVNDLNGATKIDMPGNKPVQTEIKGEDIVKRSKIIADLQKAAGVPVLLGKSYPWF